MKKILYPLCIMLFITVAAMLCADEIELLDTGQIIKGKITQETDDKIFVQNEYGNLGFDKLKVKRVSYTDGRTRVLAAPSPVPNSPAPSMAQPVNNVAAPQTAFTPIATLTPGPPPPDIKAGADAVLFGVVKEVKFRNPGGAWQEAAEGTQLKANDEILTGDGKVKIRLRGRGELRLPPNSHLVLKSISADGNDITIEMRGGTVWNNVTPGGGLVKYQVHTPDLTAGVRGTLFKVEVFTDKGTRVAVFEGTVETESDKTHERLALEQLKAAIVNPQGQLSAPQAVDPKERQEWDYWDQWALEVHEIAVRFPVGGAVIDALGQQHAEDMKRYEGIMNEANQNILANREEKKLQDLATAFENFYRDTGVIPTEEQGFKALAENPGVAGWKGPYYKEAIPPKDRWGNDLHYILGKSQVSGNVYGKVISNGLDKVYSKGNTNTDDIGVMVKYYSIKPGTK